MDQVALQQLKGVVTADILISKCGGRSRSGLRGTRYSGSVNETASVTWEGRAVVSTGVSNSFATITVPVILLASFLYSNRLELIVAA